MKSQINRFAAAVGTLLIAGGSPACSDGDSSGVPPAAGSKNLLDLTSQENRDLCAWVERRQRESLGSEDEYCSVQGLFAATSAQVCEDNKRLCIDSDEYETRVDQGRDCASAGEQYFVGSGQLCSATVADLEACIDEDADSFRELKGYSCTQAGDIDYPVGPGPACNELSEKCPDVLL